MKRFQLQSFVMLNLNTKELCMHYMRQLLLKTQSNFNQTWFIVSSATRYTTQRPLQWFSWRFFTMVWGYSSFRKGERKRRLNAKLFPNRKKSPENEAFSRMNAHSSVAFPSHARSKELWRWQLPMVLRHQIFQYQCLLILSLMMTK